MTLAQILSVVHKYHEKLEGRGIEPKKFPSSSILPTAQQALAHAQWLNEHLTKYLQDLQRDTNAGGNLDEAQRMLGFIQGVMWVIGQRTLDKLQADNRNAPS